MNIEKLLAVVNNTAIDLNWYDKENANIIGNDYMCIDREYAEGRRDLGKYSRDAKKKKYLLTEEKPYLDLFPSVNNLVNINDYDHQVRYEDKTATLFLELTKDNPKSENSTVRYDLQYVKFLYYVCNPFMIMTTDGIRSNLLVMVNKNLDLQCLLMGSRKK